MSSHGKGILEIILRGPLAVTPCAGLEVSSPRAPTLGAPLGNGQNKVSYWSPKWLLCHRASSPRGPPGSSSRARSGARGGGCSARPRWARRPPSPDAVLSALPAGLRALRARGAWRGGGSARAPPTGQAPGPCRGSGAGGASVRVARAAAVGLGTARAMASPASSAPGGVAVVGR